MSNYDRLAKAFSKEILQISNGMLQCLPYSRALLDFFELRNVAALPLVVRAVVFGSTSAVDWKNVLTSNSSLTEDLITKASQNRDANGFLSTQIVENTPDIVLPYRTIGISHGSAKEGSYEPDNSWYGHLVVIVEGNLIDLTLGQLNDMKYKINFDPKYVTFEIDDEFLKGNKPVYAIVNNNMLIIYKAYPNEDSYKESISWGKDKKFRKQLFKMARKFAAKK